MGGDGRKNMEYKHYTTLKEFWEDLWELDGWRGGSIMERPRISGGRTVYPPAISFYSTTSASNVTCTFKT